MQSEKGHKLLPELLHTTFMVSNTLIYIVLRPVLRFLTVPYEAIVPEHTRYALFQLYCDLRANPPRDRHWFMLHARRLRPHTFSGWIALGSTLLYMGSGMALLMTSLLSFAVVALYGVMFATVSVALVGGFMLGLLAFSLFITSGAAFFGATGAALGYATLAAAKASLRMLPGGSRPDPSAVPGLPESPRLRPVATPRAPVNPAIAASSSCSAPAAAIAPAAALPPDPAPASPCRRHATPTSEAFQRSSEGPAALALPPSEPAGVEANGLASGAPLPRMEAGEPAKAKAHAAPAHGAAGEAAAHASHVPNGEAHAKAGHHKLGAEAVADHTGMTAGAPKGHTSPKAAKREAAKAAAGAQASSTDKENLHRVNTADGKAQSVIGGPMGVR